MPTIHREGPYRFHFYVSDWQEPPHVHVERDNLEAKFWLSPISLQSAGGFRPVEVNRIRRIIEQRVEDFLGEWHDRFGS
ncbi:MAG: DUF4160 domain-containing protein [Dehalococcoidia bacterium]|nr:DUF4160 domain-containing protein [Dehalococcoidia bacterium]